MKIFDNQATLPSLTSQEVVAMDSSLDDDLFPVSDSPNIKTNEIVYSLASADKVGLAFSDLTGRFPIQSSRGNNYILIAYHPDANAIL